MFAIRLSLTASELFCERCAIAILILHGSQAVRSARFLLHDSSLLLSLLENSIATEAPAAFSVQTVCIALFVLLLCPPRLSSQKWSNGLISFVTSNCDMLLCSRMSSESTTPRPYACILHFFLSIVSPFCPVPPNPSSRSATSKTPSFHPRQFPIHLLIVSSI